MESSAVGLVCTRVLWVGSYIVMMGADDDDPLDANKRWITSRDRELFHREKANLLLVK